ncbi:hypothetical protein [Aquimarina pacifica]|uniref:hypothetical protein n=1 Tax=Aquimarina pacifica TaxID=1296415 RepID=UPI00047124EA|nr:hypothetical protein [Aquimarina pacifica]
MKNYLLLFAITVAILSQSCSNEEFDASKNFDEVANFTDSQEIAIESSALPDPIPTAKSMDKNDSDTTLKNHYFGPEVGQQVWNPVKIDGPSFVRNEDIIEEKNSLGVTTVTFTFEWEDDNFIYVFDDNRDMYLALPIWYPGRKNRVYWSTDLSNSWNTWEQYQYYVLVGDECDSDNEPPTTDPVCIYTNGRITCRGINSFRQSFPAEVSDSKSFLIYSLNLDDNCDTYLTIRQNPAPGTIIEKPGKQYTSYEVIDNQGNVLNVSHHVVYQLYENY